MSLSGIRGLWHMALRVKDLAQSESFYAELFGMKVVWRPDGDNVYLSSGMDNLALHQIAGEDRQRYEQHAQFLDHLGVIMDSPESVRSLYAEAKRRGVKIVKEPAKHRDGSYSCYVADPDGNTVQVLYEPTLSKIDVSREA
jgi:catechol 2,3-dioxygenase-like lactoylglutathione lyase family enzyme